MASEPSTLRRLMESDGEPPDDPPRSDDDGDDDDDDEELEPAGLCLFRHRWSMWERVDVVGAHDGERITKQERECLRCGYGQIKRLFIV